VFSARETARGDEWISVSDLMSGLMLVFLAIAVFFMVRVENEKADLENVAVLYDEIRAGLYQDLQNEFSQDLEHWNAEIDSTTLSVRFKEPDVYFAPGSAKLRPAFEEVLSDFFPRYLQVLTGPSYRDHITEVRIEGHTSSDWKDLSGLAAYEQNLILSQARTRTVVSYVVRLEGVLDKWEGWLRPRLTANGLSSGRPIMREGVEDRERSRRVEFRVRTDAEEQMAEILRRVEAN
jgi:outer membrane protein OmpA-like peptidoglycan-associated protein